MTDEPREPRPPATLDEELLGAEVESIVSTQSDANRIKRVSGELAEGFRALARVGAAVSIFGSARTPREHAEYALARETARTLGEAGFAIITGGGPGIMEAANRGARDSGALSIGLNIDLPFEIGINRYVDLPLQFHYFFTRKVMFVRYASAFVVFPGGYGTIDEMFEALTLIQTGKIRHFPVLMVGRSYWAGLVDWLRERMLAEAKISPSDMELFEVTDSPARVLEVVSSAVHRQARVA
jgi:uncharacterized protein (TIGR00730 family)